MPLIYLKPVPHTKRMLFFFQTVTNYNDHNLDSGVFTCQETGIYKFQVYALSKPGIQTFFDLYVNDIVVVSLNGNSTRHYNVPGNAVILQLEAGSTVKVKSRENVKVDLGRGDGYIHTTFTGVQIKPTLEGKLF